MLFDRVMRNYRLRKQLIIFMVSIIFIPVVVFNILFAYLYVGFYNEKINDGYKSFQNESYTNLNYKLNLYQSMLERTVYNKSVINAVAQMEGSLISAYEKSLIVDAEVENIIFGNTMEEVHSLLIFPYKRDVKVIGKYLSSITNVENQDWFLKSRDKARYICIENKVGAKLLSMSQVMYHTDEITKQTVPIALVKIEIDLDSVLKNTIYEKNNNIGVQILNNGEVCYEYGALRSGTEGKKLLFLEKDLIGEQFQIRYIFDKTPQRQMFMLIIAVICSFAAVLLLVLSMIIVHFSGFINGRIKVILDKIRRIETGDFDVAATLEGNDEFADIDRKIKAMATKLEKTINENYIIEAERKRAELLALQMQINPHFMFNTLEMINSMAKQTGCGEIGLISQKMGEILRYNINNESEYVTLRQEIKHIESYLFIQKIRYSDKFDVFFDVPQRLLNCKVLKFILQPIVENIIKYAIQPNEGTYFISITADEKDGVLTISIQDDGAGIPEQKLEQIRQNISDKTFSKSKSIGLKNVNSRIRIIYGAEYGLSISSIENVGTNVTLRFPTENFVTREGI